MDIIIETINKTNESLSIYKALVLTKDMQETYDLCSVLNEYEYPMATDFSCPEHSRIIVQTIDEFDTCANNVDFEEITVVYVTNKSMLQKLVTILDRVNMKILTIIVINTQ